MELNKKYQGDVLTVLKTWPDEFIDLIITSPHYFALRNYGVEGQLGLEKTFEEYQVKLLEIIKEIKSELKGQYKDYRDYEDEFENIIDNVDPQQISKDGLKIIFNSLRGQKIDEIVKEKEEAAVKKTMEERKIIGEITPSSSSSAGAKKEKISPAQSKEMKDMGFDTEQDYLGRLEKKRQVAKSRGATNIPDLISEILIFKS